MEGLYEEPEHPWSVGQRLNNHGVNPFFDMGGSSRLDHVSLLLEESHSLA